MLDVYPLAIPDGEGLSIPVKLVGDLGFRNDHGLLVLLVPAAVSEVVRQELAEEIASKEAVGPRFVEALGGGGFVAEFAVRLRPGMRKAVPLGKWGEIGEEAAGPWLQAEWRPPRTTRRADDRLGSHLPRATEGQRDES